MARHKNNYMCVNVGHIFLRYHCTYCGLIMFQDTSQCLSNVPLYSYYPYSHIHIYVLLCVLHSLCICVCLAFLLLSVSEQILYAQLCELELQRT
jgi:hypothetical protein